MIAVAPTYQLNRWRMQPCNDTYISGLDHAKFAATAHGGCNLFIAAAPTGGGARMSWRITRDPDRDMDKPQGILLRNDGTWAVVFADGRVVDVSDNPREDKQ
ncbi:hypothetical protein OHB12_22210 [Nocardia sp. NBC_01730]|uniref:hypothetical protein n=1 Tax=Nocardia sp. NBC_01730 TaxID=2975998 RepID=UPI002E10E5A5|nr:hypothetical protein OHB12_22210 [Nocardia sp. NBC_01730]